MRRALTLPERALLTVSGVACALALCGAAMDVRMNLTESAPVGLWTTEPVDPDAIYRGRMVEICPPNVPETRAMVAEGYLSAGDCAAGGVPLLKPIVAVPGDQVTVRADGVRVNGTLLANSAPGSVVLAGVEIAGYGIDGTGTKRTYEVLPGQVWVISSYSPASFDSRYFGPVRIGSVRGLADPLITRGDLTAVYQRIEP